MLCGPYLLIEIMEARVIYLSMFLHENHLLILSSDAWHVLKFLIQKHLGLSLCNFVEQSKMDEKNHAEQNKIHGNVEQMEKVSKCHFLYQSGLFSWNGQCHQPAISTACTDPEYAKCSIISTSYWWELF